MFRKLTDWIFAPEQPPSQKYKYAAPANALNVGPVFEGWPAYMRIWRDDASKRIKFEFRNKPGVTICMDARIAPLLASALLELELENRQSLS